MTLSRRELLKASAWAVPVIAATVTTSLAAASEVTKPSRIAFTNTTATEGANPNTAYVNCKVLVLDGPEPVTNVQVIITVEQAGEVKLRGGQVHGATLPGWGVTGLIAVEASGLDKAAPITVRFVATADNAETIEQTVTIQPPSWWD